MAKYEKAVDDGYSVYYNSLAVSGSAIGITEYTLHSYDIVYDDDKKIIKVMHK